MTSHAQQANTRDAEVAAALSWFKPTDGCAYNNPPTPSQCPTCAGWMLAREVEKLREELRDAKGLATKTETMRQYHMNAINRMAEAIGMLGEASDAIADAVLVRVAKLAFLEPINDRLMNDRKELLNERAEWRAANSRLASALKSLREAANASLESLISTEHCLGIVRPALEKIEGPSWPSIFESLEEDMSRLQDALAETK